MTEVGDSSSTPASSVITKPVIVRVKRKASQSPLEAFWLEISGRPLKRPLLDFEKLSISESSGKEELKTRRVFMHHVDTVNSTEATIDVLQSVVHCGSDEDSFEAKHREQRHTFKKENIQDQLLSKARQEQEVLAKSARFEQIWKSRRRNKETVRDVPVDEVCRLYDVVRVDDGEMPGREKREEMSVEDQEALSKILPLMREFIPVAAEEIESDMRSYVSGQDLSEKKDEYMYDLYTVAEDIDEADNSHQFPLVHVDDDDDFYDGPEHSDYETDDSNDENHPFNDYPDEMPSEDDEESKTSGRESEEESESDSEDESEDIDRLAYVNKRADQTLDSDMDDYYYEEEDGFDHIEEGGDDGKDLQRWVY